MSSSPSRPQSQSSPTCTPSAAQPPSTALSRPLAELVGASFAPFDTDTVVLPITQENNRDVDFQRVWLHLLRQLAVERFLDAALEAHAWASARAFHETQVATETFEKQIVEIQATEHDQGMFAPSFFGRRIFCAVTLPVSRCFPHACLPLPQKKRANGWLNS
ncbi:hypothetical protein FB45DRAFT_1027873 [Roridomyces roridus]|uniref:Uncharacterized protein n=1 Tax=Roridomyces roridus TaxID=1738132 RepID=A0AAD7BUB8_9AGAR|nr:hypothetical protein FB45DRAFT_1027873 [Roridomyces roridus]